MVSSMRPRALRDGCLLALLLTSGAHADGASPRLGPAGGSILRVDGPRALFTVNEAGEGADLNDDGDQVDDVVHVFDARSGATRNLGLSVFPSSFDAQLRNPLVVVLVPEATQGGRDLNGDGDADDSVLHVFDAERGTVRNLRLATSAFAESLLDGRRVAFGVSEAGQGGADLNGDGDATDDVLHVFDAGTQRILNTRLAGGESGLFEVALDERALAVRVSELRQGERDLNGDGDAVDLVTHLVSTRTGRVTNLRLATSDSGSLVQPFAVAGDAALALAEEFAQGSDLNGDGDQEDVVLHLVDVASGRVRNLGLETSLGVPQLDPAEDLAVFKVREDFQGHTDLNGDGDTFDAVVHFLDTESGRVRSSGISAGLIALLENGRLAVGLLEENVGRDLNGDGDALDQVVHLASARSARIVNTHMAIASPQVPFAIPAAASGSLFSFLSNEAEQGRDLNGDADLDDFVLQVSDLARGVTRNSGLESLLMSAAVFPTTNVAPSRGRYVVPVQEAGQGGTDLNGDGDTDDVVLHVFDARQGTSRNSGLPVASVFTFFTTPLLVRADGNVSIAVREADASADLNGDGDLEDGVLHIVDLATGTATNVRLALGLPALPTIVGVPPFEFRRPTGRNEVGLGDAYTFVVSEAAQGGTDLNGDGDADDLVVRATRLEDRDRDRVFDLGDDRIER